MRGDYLLLAHEIPEAELRWFTDWEAVCPTPAVKSTAEKFNEKIP